MSNENEHKKLEREALLTILLETEKLSNVGGCEWDIIKDVWTFSDNWLLIHGCTKRHLSSSELLPITHPDDRARIQKAFDKAISEGVNYEIEHRIIKQNTGEERFIRACGAPRLDKGGRPVKLYGSVQDITTQKRTENSLQKERAMFKTIVDRLPIMITRYDPDANMLFLNNEFEKKIGWTTKEVQDIDLMEKVYPDQEYREQAFKYMQKASKDWREFKVTCRSGQTLESEWSNIKLEDGTQIGIGIDITERKKAEEKLHSIELDLKDTYDISPSIISKANIDTGYFVDASPLVSQILGYSVEEFTSKPIMDFIHPDDRQKTIDEISEQLVGKGVAFFENRYLCKDGTYKWMAWHGTPADESGIVTAIGSDINSRKQAENALKESQKRFQYAMDATKDGLYDWNLTTNEIYYSPGWKRMLGYEDHELPNDFSVWETLTDPEDVKRSWEMQQELINKERDRFEMEFKMKHKDGHWVNILSRATVNFDHNGKAVRIVGTHVDITERKQIEEVIRKSENRYRTILQTAIDGFWITDINGHFLEVNSAYSEMSGYSQNELLTMQISDIEASENPEEVEEHLKKGIAKGYDRFESLHRRKDNSTYPVEINFTYLDREGGKFVVFIKDISERKEVENNLLKNQYHLTKAQEIGKMGTWELDIQKDILIWTDENYRIFGVPFGTKLSYEKFLSCVHPEDRAYVDKKWNEALKTKAYDIMHRVVADNKIKWVREKADIEFNLDGEPITAVGFTQDLTGLREIETALQESEKKFKTMFEKAPLSYQSLDENGCFTEVNQTWLKTMGYTREEVLGKNFSEFLVPEWKNHFKENFPRFKAVGEILGIEFEMVKKDGAIILVSFHGKIGKNEKGDFKQTHCIFQDITNLRQAEASSNRLKERLESLWNITKIADSDIKTISDHVLVEVQKMTQSQYAFYGFIDNNENEMILHAWSSQTMDDCKTNKDILHFPIDKAGIWAESVKDKRILTINDFNLDRPGKKGIPDGHVHLTRLMVVPYIKEDKVISIVAVANKKAEYSNEDEKQVLAFMRNVQLLIDRKTAEQEAAELATQLQQMQKMESIGNLAGGIAHDFNNLLFPIIGNSEMLLEDLPSNSFEYENAQEIYDAGKRASELVQQILAFSRQSEHKMVPVRLQNIVKEALKLGRSTIPTDIEILQDIQTNCGSVLADATQIHQVVMNLVTNAYHAVQEKSGKISVQLKQIKLDKETLPDITLKQDQCIMLSVSDTGVGIDPDNVKKIFEPYFTTKEKGKGTGLGLAVVFGIIKEHQGDIKVYSEVGKGTTFTVYLPLIDKTTRTIPTDQAQEIEVGTERVLLVDDEISIVKLEGQMLLRLGYRVTQHTSSLDALNIFKANPENFDLVITDMTMPKMTGDQLAREFLQIRPDIPIIICTGFSERFNKERAKMIGVKGFLMKPVVKSDMAKMVRKILDEAKSAD